MRYMIVSRGLVADLTNARSTRLAPLGWQGLRRADEDQDVETHVWYLEIPEGTVYSTGGLWPVAKQPDGSWSTLVPGVFWRMG